MGKMLLNGTVVTPLIVKDVGTKINNQDITVTENGTYTAEDGYTGLGTVEVNVPTGGGVEIKNQDITVTVNGSYTADEGYTGLGTVNVNVANPSTGTLEIVKNGIYDVSNYASADVNVPAGGEPVNKEKFGLTIDDLIGDVNENGEYVFSPTKQFDFTLTGVRVLTFNAFTRQFLNNKSINRFVLPDLETASSACLESVCEGSSITEFIIGGPVKETNFSDKICYNAPNLEKVDFGHVESLGLSDHYYWFGGCKKLKRSGLRFVKRWSSYGPNATATIMWRAYQTSGVEEIECDCLEQVYGYAQNTFNGCPIISAYFPMLHDLNHAHSLGNSTSNGIFQACNSLFDIHFRKNMQTTIEKQTAYTAKFGAKNATIYFDLISRIVVNGVNYARSEYDSPRVDYNKTYIAWKADSGEFVYTSYDQKQEPAVGAIVYSDHGTTQVGTVTEVE
jgi:hypothetical protein